MKIITTQDAEESYIIYSYNGFVALVEQDR